MSESIEKQERVGKTWEYKTNKRKKTIKEREGIEGIMLTNTGSKK